MLKGEDGAKNLKDAEALFDGKLEGFIKENPELAKFLVPSGLEHMKELQLKLEKLVKLQEKLRALQLKASELNEKHYALKKEDEKLLKEAELLSKSGKKEDMDKLENNTNRRKEILGEMKSLKSEYKQPIRQLEELSAEFSTLA